MYHYMTVNQLYISVKCSFITFIMTIWNENGVKLMVSLSIWILTPFLVPLIKIDDFFMKILKMMVKKGLTHRIMTRKNITCKIKKNSN